jgi:Phospholipase_D-nuclease N-terminal/Short C-terminal domain
MLGFDLGDAIWLVIISFFFIMYLMMLFSVVIDLFRDRELSGLMKALWVIALLFLPLLTLLVYLIVRGKGMAERSVKEQVDAKESFDAYVKSVSGGGAAAELEKAGALLDSGKISQAEFDALKAKILS